MEYCYDIANGWRRKMLSINITLTFLPIFLPEQRCLQFKRTPHGPKQTKLSRFSWHLTLFTWPHFKVLFMITSHALLQGSKHFFSHLCCPHGSFLRQGSLHWNSTGSMWHGTCCTWWQFGISLATKTLQTSHFSQQRLEHLMLKKGIIYQFIQNYYHLLLLEQRNDSFAHSLCSFIIPKVIWWLQA